MIVRFRVAEQSDLSEIRDCVEAAYRPYVAELGVEPAPLHADYQAHVQAGNVRIVEKADGEFVGIMVTYLEPDCLVVDNVAILPRHQRRGALVPICVEVVGLATAAGAHNVRAFTNQKLARNIGLYQKLGLAIDRVERMADRTAVHMRCDLRALDKSPALARRILRPGRTGKSMPTGDGRSSGICATR